MKKHITLLGDSSFDNDRYVGAVGKSVEQWLKELTRSESGWHITLDAQDGATIASIPKQLRDSSSKTTDYVMSVGGNDALRSSDLMTMRVEANDFLQIASARAKDFEYRYYEMMNYVKTYMGASTLTICTIYNPNFERGLEQNAGVEALKLFNDVIIRAGTQFSVPVLDLRLIFSTELHYANAIEPSSEGGLSLASAIVALLKGEARGTTINY